ncbi:MAG: hypothetical protein K6B46_00460 [Opitutales bacterium]|nr:hypothetical protein [Opitutales bacterium]
MKKFLLKLSLFFSACLLAFAGIYGTYFWRIRTLSFSLPRDKTIVFIGDSHIECGVDPALIPGAFNFAKSSDPYLDQYCRLKMLLKDNPQIKTIFITATPHSLARYGDERIWGKFTLRNVVTNALPLYGKEELKIYSQPQHILKIIKFYLQNPIGFARKDTKSREQLISQLGAYLPLDTKELQRSIAAEKGEIPGIKSKFHGNEQYGNALQLKYLKKIIALAREHDCKIILLNPPIYHAREFLDVDYFETVMAEHFPDVEYWDYADFPVPDDCRRDINHLNRYGAPIFSKKLAERIREENL